MSGSSGKKVLMKGLLLGQLSFYLMLFLFLAITSALLRGSILQTGSMRTAVLASLSVSAVVAALISAGRKTDKRMIYALLPSAGFMTLVILARLLFPAGEKDDAFTWLTAAAVMLPALVIGLKRGKKRRKR